MSCPSMLQAQNPPRNRVSIEEVPDSEEHRQGGGEGSVQPRVEEPDDDGELMATPRRCAAEFPASLSRLSVCVIWGKDGGREGGG